MTLEGARTSPNQDVAQHAGSAPAVTAATSHHFVSASGTVLLLAAGRCGRLLRDLITAGERLLIMHVNGGRAALCAWRQGFHITSTGFRDVIISSTSHHNSAITEAAS